ncbi:MAG: hypothetical protein ACTH5S_11150 [Hafnia alvei]|uniref:hypothetical protein n=1 Tax=Hafnia alvei TaxID=569 RepID=UPI003F8F20F9
MKILKAQPEDVKKILPLYLGYRKFYEVSESKEAAEEFLTNRITLGESVIYYVEDNGKAVGLDCTPKVGHPTE